MPLFPLSWTIAGGFHEDTSVLCSAWSLGAATLDSVFFLVPCISDLSETCPPGPDLSDQDGSLEPGFASGWWAQDGGRHAPCRAGF